MGGAVRLSQCYPFEKSVLSVSQSIALANVTISIISTYVEF